MYEGRNRRFRPGFVHLIFGGRARSTIVENLSAQLAGTAELGLISAKRWNLKNEPFWLVFYQKLNFPPYCNVPVPGQRDTCSHLTPINWSQVQYCMRKDISKLSTLLLRSSKHLMLRGGIFFTFSRPRSSAWSSPKVCQCENCASCTIYNPWKSARLTRRIRKVTGNSRKPVTFRVFW